MDDYKVKFNELCLFLGYRWFIKDINEIDGNLYIGLTKWSDIQIEEMGFVIFFCDEDKLWEHAIYVIEVSRHLSNPLIMRKGRWKQ